MILSSQKISRAAAVAGVAIAALVSGPREAAAGEKDRYTLFDPVPRAQMRPLSADRPDATESPYTVDAGHVQLEMDIASYLRDRAQEDRSPVRVTGYGFGITNLKVGVTNRIDAQLVVATFLRVETEDRAAGTKDTMDGFGDLVLRLKINLFGNDRGDQALAVMPFLKFPTNQDDLGNNDVEGGVIVPFAVELPRGWGLGLQIEFDVVRNGADTHTDLDVSQTIVLGHDIAGDLAGFVELFSLFPADDTLDWIGTLNAGLTYAVTPDVQLDLGVNVGLSRSADDLVVFVGITIRR